MEESAKMKSKIKHALISLTALCFAILPPGIAVLEYFPLFKSRADGSVLSGFVIILLTICGVPLFKLLQRAVKSPTAIGIWFAVFIIFFFLSKIADEMCVISLAGFIGNLIAALIWKLDKKLLKKENKKSFQED